MKKILIPLLLGICTIACNKKKVSAEAFEEAKRAISESNIIYWQAFVKGEAALFIERYSTDACIMPPNAPAMCGKTAAPAFFNAAYHQMNIRNGKFTTLEIFPGNENYVTEYGLFELRDNNQNLLDEGKYLVLWKKTEQGWKMFRDCFNSNHLSIKN